MKAGFMKVAGKGDVPAQPMIVKARYFTKQTTVLNLVPPCVIVSLQLVRLWEPGCWTPRVRTKNTVPTPWTHVLTAILVNTKILKASRLSLSLLMMVGCSRRETVPGFLRKF